ncbi:hypothetical protein SAMN05216304_108209 [Bosea sp. OK403]|uniref:hypothetical protein n=1 Tax=Bosea sp. OK403 TaxID=1855286 RepID=UPI0008E64887|nr:hypothetical protein [Bosea sp. OK403]SFJ48018.1 hypothetical protein SAMN05216304_108209 [Bosea sp. OK403]
MTDFDDHSRSRAPFAVDSASDLAMVLLQLAACRAEIGPFARSGRETPQEAARVYEAARTSKATPIFRDRRPMRL